MPLSVAVVMKLAMITAHIHGYFDTHIVCVQWLGFV